MAWNIHLHLRLNHLHLIWSSTVSIYTDNINGISMELQENINQILMVLIYHGILIDNANGT